MYLYLETGRVLTGLKASEVFKITRQHASDQLKKLENNNIDIKSYYRQKRIGGRVCSVKYYKLIK